MNFWMALGALVLATAVMYAGLSINGKTEQADGHGHDDHGHGHGGHH